MRRVVCLIVASVLIGAVSANAQTGCFSTTQTTGQCYAGTLSCTFNSFVDHKNFGVTVGDLCDQVAAANNNALVLRASLQQLGADYNNVLGTRATAEINTVNCINAQKVLEQELATSEATVNEVLLANTKLRRALKRAKLKAARCQ